MIREEAILIFKEWVKRDSEMQNTDKLENIEVYNMAIKSLEAWERVKEELKESSYERYFEFGEYVGEDTQKVRIISFDTAMSIIGKHLAEVSE